MKRLSIFIYVLITVFTLATSVHAASNPNNERTWDYDEISYSFLLRWTELDG